MIQRTKVGDVYVELRTDLPTPRGPSVDTTLRAEKPDMPEALEEQPYIYRPNDPFRAYVDEARAIASIGPQQKLWVRKAWFVIFVLGPLIFIELRLLSIVIHQPAPEAWRTFLVPNLWILPLWALYYAICRRRLGRFTKA